MTTVFAINFFLVWSFSSLSMVGIVGVREDTISFLPFESSRRLFELGKGLINRLSFSQFRSIWCDLLRTYYLSHYGTVVSWLRLSMFYKSLSYIIIRSFLVAWLWCMVWIYRGIMLVNQAHHNSICFK